jgi:hypothetical protein
MTFGNLLSASAERNPRRAAIVLEKDSISHVLRPRRAVSQQFATPSPRAPLQESSTHEGQHNWREMCVPGIQHALACLMRCSR